MGDQLMTVACESGVLTFDGKVVELFGFGRQDFSIRMHVARMKEVKFNEGGRFSGPAVIFKAEGMKIDGFAKFTEEEAKSSEVTSLIEAVRAAAPNLSE